MKEREGDTYMSVPKEKSILFKLRCNYEKRLYVGLCQMEGLYQLPIVRYVFC